MQVCDQCGRCCFTEGMYIHATKSDLERWEKIGFTDILQYLDPETLELWVDRKTGKKMEVCPYMCSASNLEDRRIMYFCLIQDKKPEKCKAYVCLRKEMGTELSDFDME